MKPFVHLELTSTDVGAAKTFYGALFGWRMFDMPIPGGGGTYTLLSPADAPPDVCTGGMMQAPREGMPSMWLPYLYVDDIRAHTEKARSLGATIHMDCHEVPETGWLTVFTDPAGATCGVWQPMGPK